jgi:hypothetical protein
MNIEKWMKLVERAPYAHKICGKNIRYKTVEEQLAEVRNNGYVIQYIHDPCLEVQLEAVKQYGDTIRYIRNPCNEVQLEAVKQDCGAIRYIHDPCREAIFLYLVEVASDLMSDPEFDLVWEEDDG